MEAIPHGSYRVHGPTKQVRRNTMKDLLRHYWGDRIRVRALFSGCGSRNGGRRRSLSFQNVMCVDTGELLRRHTWIPAEDFEYLRSAISSPSTPMSALTRRRGTGFANSVLASARADVSGQNLTTTSLRFGTRTQRWRWRHDLSTTSH